MNSTLKGWKISQEEERFESGKYCMYSIMRRNGTLTDFYGNIGCMLCRIYYLCHRFTIVWSDVFLFKKIFNVSAMDVSTENWVWYLPEYLKQFIMDVETKSFAQRACMRDARDRFLITLK